MAPARQRFDTDQTGCLAAGRGAGRAGVLVGCVGVAWASLAETSPCSCAQKWRTRSRTARRRATRSSVWDSRASAMRASSAASLASQACWAALAGTAVASRAAAKMGISPCFIMLACCFFVVGRSRAARSCAARDGCAAGRSDRPVRHGTPEFSPISGAAGAGHGFSLTALWYFLYNSGLFRIHAHGKRTGRACTAPRSALRQAGRTHRAKHFFWIDHEDVFRKSP